eukprot:scaffold264266_cov49-Tisochrysis_lutea.AAC.1
MSDLAPVVMALPSVHHVRVFELLWTEQQSPQTGVFKRLQSFSTTKRFPLPERMAEYLMPDVALCFVLWYGAPRVSEQPCTEDEAEALEALLRSISPCTYWSSFLVACRNGHELW